MERPAVRRQGASDRCVPTTTERTDLAGDEDGVRTDLGGERGYDPGRVAGPDRQPSADAPQLLVEGAQAAEQVPGAVG